ncbi:MAG: lytic murein transglycosylase [Nocardioides sp.]|jgi:hypothetical protein
MRRWGVVATGLLLALIPTVLATQVTARTQGSAALPDGSQVPAAALQFPASLTLPTAASEAALPAGPLEPGVVVADDEGASDEVLTTPSQVTFYDIPSPALAAYQRAETVINAADPDCRLPWQLLAAIGRVESNHGRFAGSQLGNDGVARPPIIGIALNGKATSRVDDTDGGQLDGDDVFDRAVGPMQFIPSTWAAVGVDADGDDVRNPQDIDDAALASAVYLCAGSADLSSSSGQHDAVYRYNHSEDYVALVLSIAADYGSTGLSFPVSTGPSSYPSAYPTSSAPTQQSTASATPSASQGPAQPGSGPNAPSLPEVTTPAAGAVLTAAEAAAQCLSEGYVNNPLRSGDAFDKCVARYTH